MEWFKILLLVLIGIKVIDCLCEVAKGEYTRESKPIYSAIGAILNTLLCFGIWLLL
jgi:hypothetical protein